MTTEKLNSSQPIKKKDKKELLLSFKRLYSFLNFEEKIKIALGMTALSVNAITNLSFPYILGQALDHNQTLDVTSSMGLFLSGSSKFLLQSAAFFLVGSISSWVRVYYLGTATESIASRMRVILFSSCMDKDMEFFQVEKNGELISVMEKDVADSAEVFTERIAAGLRSLNSALNGSLLLYWTSPKLCMVSLSVVPIVGVGAMSLAKYSRRMTDEQRRLQSDILSYSLERFSCFSTVTLNGRQEYEKEVFASLAVKSQHIADKKHYAQGSFMGYLNMATNCALLAVLKVGGDMIKEGNLTPGALTRFAIQSAFVGLGFSGLSTFYSDMLKSLDSATRVFELIDRNSQCKDTRKVASKIVQGQGGVIPSAAAVGVEPAHDFSVEFKDVSFSYRSRPTVRVLNDLSVKIADKRITCFVGESGSGKSTFAALLCGLYRPLTGSVRIGGRLLVGSESNAVDAAYERDTETGIRAEPAEDVAGFIHRSIGVVEQSSVALLSGTIAFNIGYGKSGASQEEIERAAKAAFAHDFITNLLLGYETEMGVSGSFLSGGQRVRIAIARALVKNPPCLLLDEVTAALDANSEAEVLKVLDSLRREKTIVILTHSPAVQSIADEVYSIENGSCRLMIYRD